MYVDVGVHIYAVVYTTSYVRQNLVVMFYYTAKIDVEHVDRGSALRWRSQSYIRGGIAAVGLYLYVSWVIQLIVCM